MPSNYDGFFIVDGNLVRLDKEGKIIQPEYRMRDIPIQSVFEMNSKQRDPQMSKMTYLNNKLKLMRGFNKSQARRNVREDPSLKQIGNHFKPGFEAMMDQKRTNTSSKTSAKGAKSVIRPSPTINYPHQTPYAQQQLDDYPISRGGSYALAKNNLLIVNNDLEDILESSGRGEGALITPKQNQSP